MLLQGLGDDFVTIQAVRFNIKILARKVARVLFLYQMFIPYLLNQFMFASPLSYQD